MSTKPCSITQGVPWNHSSSKICAEESPPVRWLIENSPRMWEGFHERGQVLTRDKLPVARQPASGSGQKGSRSLRTRGWGHWQRAVGFGDHEQPPAQSERRVIFFISGHPLVKMLLPKPSALRRRQAFVPNFPFEGG